MKLMVKDLVKCFLSWKNDSLITVIFDNGKSILTVKEIGESNDLLNAPVMYFKDDIVRVNRLIQDIVK